MASDGYAEYDSIKEILRIDDDSMRDEIQIYMHQVDQLIDNRIRAKLGEVNVYGETIVLPLTYNTIPTVDLELKGIANDMVVAKIRLQNSEKPLLWDAVVKVLDNYLDMRFGWTRDVPWQPTRTLTISPRTGAIGATITIGGTNFEPHAKLTIVFDSTEPTTTPASVVTDSDGVFSAITFTVPANQPDGSYKIKVYDNFGGLEKRFQVTS